MDLAQCLHLIKNAKTDNEKMAAMLLVSKLVQSDKIKSEDRKKVFDAVGFSFINRLLSTNTIPEGCTENPYQKIALTLLACFCTDQDLVLHPQITTKIPLFNEFVLQGATTSPSQDEGSSISEDALQCLQALSGSNAGLQHVMRTGTLEVLAKAYINQVRVSETAKDLLLYIFANKDAQSIETFAASALAAILILVETFKTNQDELKFQLCDVLISVLSLSGDTLISQSSSVQTKWLSEIALGLKDILMSKVDPPRRNKAIHLSAVLCQTLGAEWAVMASTKLFTLLAHLVSVEVRLAMEDKELSEVSEATFILCSCFIIIEHSVIYIAKQSELYESSGRENLKICLLSEEDLLQLHMTLSEAFTCIVQFLQGVVTASTAATDSVNPPEHTSHSESVFYEPLVVASVRVLGAWLAEDSLTLSSKVYHLLPSLIKIYSKCARSNEQYNEDSDILKFLLPGLCHMTADDKPRKILLKENFQECILSYMQSLLPFYNSSSELCGRLSLCCGVLHNVCVCDAEVVKNDEAFTSIAVGCLKVITSGARNIPLSMNALLLFLMITRRQGTLKASSKVGTPLDSVWLCVSQLLLNSLLECAQIKAICAAVSSSLLVTSSSSTSGNGGVWEEISELWYLSIQEFTALMAGCNGKEMQYVVTSPAIKMLTEILPTIAEHQNGMEGLEPITSSLSVLIQVCTTLTQNTG